MTLVKAAVGILCLGGLAALATPAAAQPTASSAAAREFTSLMAERQLDAFAIEDSETASRFAAALLIPGVQLLVVSAEYPSPDDLKARLGQKDYRDVYAALHQPVSASTRFFLIDLACDGLSAKGDGVDILYEKGTTQTLFNGDWKAQGLTEAEYRKRVEDADRQYTRVLTRLREALKAAASGA
jgi:hypothetical protein